MAAPFIPDKIYDLQGIPQPTADGFLKYAAATASYSWSSGTTSSGSGVPPGFITPEDYGASGSNQTTTIASASSGTTLNLSSAIDFKVGQGIAIQDGAGTGVELVTKITGISGTQVTIQDPLAGTLTSGTVYHDDTAALNASYATGQSILYKPGATYNITSSLTWDTDGQAHVCLSGLTLWSPTNAAIINVRGDIDGVHVTSTIGIVNGLRVEADPAYRVGTANGNTSAGVTYGTDTTQGSVPSARTTFVDCATHGFFKNWNIVSNAWNGKFVRCNASTDNLAATGSEPPLSYGFYFKMNSPAGGHKFYEMQFAQVHTGIYHEGGDYLELYGVASWNVWRIAHLAATFQHVGPFTIADGWFDDTYLSGITTGGTNYINTIIIRGCGIHLGKGNSSGMSFVTAGSNVQVLDVDGLFINSYPFVRNSSGYFVKTSALRSSIKNVKTAQNNGTTINNNWKGIGITSLAGTAIIANNSIHYSNLGVEVDPSIATGKVTAVANDFTNNSGNSFGNATNIGNLV